MPAIAAHHPSAAAARLAAAEICAQCVGIRRPCGAIDGIRLESSAFFIGARP
jgi:hypothetical protein